MEPEVAERIEQEEDSKEDKPYNVQFRTTGQQYKVMQKCFTRMVLSRPILLMHL
jgi:hypothetical protein